jgi:hypothetical protein
MHTSTISVSRPRVYLIDFEVAISFPPERPVVEYVSAQDLPWVAHFLNLKCIPVHLRLRWPPTNLTACSRQMPGNWASVFATSEYVKLYLSSSHLRFEDNNPRY